MGQVMQALPLIPKVKYYERDILEMLIATVFPRLNPDPFGMILALLSNSSMFKRYLAWFSLWNSATFLRTMRLWWQQNLILN